MVTFDELWNYGVTQMHTNQFFSAAAFSSVLLSLGYTLRRIPYFIWARIYRKIHYSAIVEQESFLYYYVLLYVKHKYPQNLRRVEAKGVHNSNKALGKEIIYNQENDTNYFWFNRRRLTLRAVKEKLEHAENFGSMFNRTYSISGLFAKRAINKFLDEALEYGVQHEIEQAKVKEKIHIYVYDSSFYRGWKQLDNTVGKTFDEIFLEDKNKIMADLEFFKLEKIIYEKVKVPYKRGYVFYGLPGNGKSALAYAMAGYLKYDIYSFTLNGMRDSDLVKNFNEVPPKSIILIEDIDSFYDGREPKGENKVSFSTFINVLSGVGQKNEVITVFTTNKIESLDPALLRDSRCDFKLEIKNPSKEVAEEYLSSIFEANVTLPKELNIGFAQLQNLTLKNHSNLNLLIESLYEPSTSSEFSSSCCASAPELVFE